MKKKDMHKKDLKELLSNFLKTGEEEPLIQYFLTNSNLPGRRGNIEMATALEEIIREEFKDNVEEIWTLGVKLANISPNDAPINTPEEIVPFCGTRALGALGAISDNHFETAMTILKDLANDTRWRMREAVAAALEQILIQRGELVLNQLKQWIKDDNWLEMRALVAAVAHPNALHQESHAKTALELHKTIFKRILDTKDRKSEPYKVLTKGLCYTLSVVTQVTPKEGFSYMKHLIELNDTGINRIVRENLKKNRLKKNYPKEVASLFQILP